MTRRLVHGLLAFLVALVSRGIGAQDRTPPTTIDQFFEEGGPARVVAHRGFSARAPENTLAAVRAAVAVGADMAEVDLRMTADGAVVLLHDDKVQATSNGRGRVAELNLEEIKELDAGSWFSAEYSGEAIPTLEEALDEAKGHILLNLEVKQETVAQGIVEKLVEAVRAKKMVDVVLVSSFSRQALLDIRQRAPEIRTAVLYKPKYWSTRDPEEMLRVVGAVAFHVNRRRLSRSMEERCAEREIPMGVYTANTPGQMQGLLKRSVHAIFTDHPDVLRSEIARRENERGAIENRVGQSVATARR